MKGCLGKNERALGKNERVLGKNERALGKNERALGKTWPSENTEVDLFLPCCKMVIVVMFGYETTVFGVPCCFSLITLLGGILSILTSTNSQIVFCLSPPPNSLSPALRVSFNFTTS